MEPWPLFWYTRFIQSLSMSIQTFSFLAFFVPEKSVTKIFKNGKILKPTKGDNSKSYGLLATILQLHHSYLRNKMWYKFHRSRTTNSRPQWLSWMRRPNGDLEVAGSTPAEVGNILSWRLIMWSWNIFYGHSLPSADSRRAVVSFWRNNVHRTG